MKTPSTVLACGGVLLLTIVVNGYTLHTRSLQREWPATQLKSAVSLTKAISIYRDTHGSYPDRLFDLVDGGVISTDHFEQLQFRSSPEADADDWLYHRPNELSDIAIVAPVLIYPWRGHSGLRATARADGGGELILGLKAYRIPPWAANTQGEQDAPSNR